jgi:hypothetical protein
MNVAQLLAAQVPAWVAVVPAALFVGLELLRFGRDANRPDHHAELLSLQRELIKSHGSSITTIAGLARPPEET